MIKRKMEKMTDEEADELQALGEFWSCEPRQIGTRDGTVHIRNVEFQGKHGASADERRSSRRFQVDVDLIDPHGARRSRAIGSPTPSTTATSASCGADRRGAPLSSCSRRWPRRCCARCGKRWPQAQITIELRKLHPPCPGNPDYTAVRS